MSVVALETPAFRFVNQAPPANCVVTEVLEGLKAEQKQISPKYFYDDYGSQLFEAITEQPEYYPTRTELGILQHYAGEIAQVMGRDNVLLEPGAGNCQKVRLLLDALRPAAYVPIDIAGDFLQSAAATLRQEYPWLALTATQADFTEMMSLPDSLPAQPRRLFYPGSTLGNLEPQQASQFLRHARELVGSDGGLLIGVDQHKDRGILDAAYNDAAGITARFNRNILTHLNELLPADFEADEFKHIARYNENAQRIEMYLESPREQSVRCAGEVIELACHERILTEYSYKYTPDSFARLADTAQLQIEQCWQDDQDLFAVYYLTPQRQLAS